MRKKFDDRTMRLWWLRECRTMRCDGRKLQLFPRLFSALIDGKLNLDVGHRPGALPIPPRHKSLPPKQRLKR
jgi:hypothetical protein